LLNAATGGYKQSQQVNVLTFLLINGVKPDIVLNIDGFNIYDLTLSELRRMIGIVPQETILFSGTVLDNIKKVKV